MRRKWLISLVSQGLSLKADSGQDTGDMVDAFSLCFEDKALETCYRNYRFEMGRKNLLGRSGLIPAILTVTSAGLGVLYCEHIFSYFQATVSSCDKYHMLLLLPASVFSSWCWMTFIKKRPDKITERTFAQNFVRRWAWVVGLTECLAVLLLDFVPECDECPKNRFRCPSALGSTEFSSRMVVFEAILIFHLAPSFSFAQLLGMVAVMFLPTRIVCFPARKQSWISLWSNCCCLMQIFLFLVCRYSREMHHRTNFVLQLHIRRLRANMQRALDNMMPRAISERVKRGELVLEACERATVLCVSFKTEDSVGDRASPLRLFRQLDDVHKALDAMLDLEGLPTHKLEGAGAEYLLVSPSLIASLEGRPVAPPDEEDALCARLTRLAVHMHNRARVLLAGSGVGVSVMVCCGPALGAVLGARQQQLQVFAPALTRWEDTVGLRRAWRVLCSGADPAQLQRAGLTLTPLPMADAGGLDIAEVSLPDAAAAQDPPAPAARGRKLVSKRSFVSADMDEPGGEEEATADLAEAMGRVAAWSGDLLDPADEHRFRLEHGAGADPDAALASRRRTLLVVASQTLFLGGMALGGGGGGDAAAAAAIRKVAMVGLVASLAAAGMPLGLSEAGRWGVMHGCMGAACMAMAWIWPDPFLFLGLSTCVSLACAAPPTDAAGPALAGSAGLTAGFLGVFGAASRREGLAPPSPRLAMQAAGLVYCLFCFLRQQRRTARVHWTLMGLRRREQAGLCGVLRQLLPDMFALDLDRGPLAAPHVRQVVVLHVQLPGLARAWCRSPPAQGCTEGGEEEWRPLLEALHEVVSRFDEEVSHVRVVQKADSRGFSYQAVGAGPESLPDVLALALRLRAVLGQLGGGGGGPPQEHSCWSLRAGVAQGQLVAGGLGAGHRRVHLLGAAAEAESLAAAAGPGEVLVPRGLARAAGAGFDFRHREPAGGPLALLGRRKPAF